MTYEYACAACGNEWEAEQSIRDQPLKKCPKCGKLKAKRQISRGAGFILKGGGWYADGYGSAKGGGQSGGDKTASETKGDGDKPSAGTTGDAGKTASGTKGDGDKTSGGADSGGKAAASSDSGGDKTSGSGDSKGKTAAA
jgi:putative FmdB family regulatory protein